MIDIDQILRGELPQGLQARSEACRQLAGMQRKSVPAVCMIVAAARREDFTKDLPGWLTWCRETLDLQGSDRDHRRAVGDMLLDTQGSETVYSTLIASGFDKLLALTRMDPSELGGFLAKYKIASMERDEVRAAVKTWLGEPVEDDKTQDQPELPGFDLILRAVTSMTPDALKASVSDDAGAVTSVRAGLGILGAGLEYIKHKRDVARLQMIRKGLLDEAASIEALLSEE